MLSESFFLRKLHNIVDEYILSLYIKMYPMSLGHGVTRERLDLFR